MSTIDSLKCAGAKMLGELPRKEDGQYFDDWDGSENASVELLHLLATIKTLSEALGDKVDLPLGYSVSHIKRLAEEAYEIADAVYDFLSDVRSEVRAEEYEARLNKEASDGQ